MNHLEFKGGMNPLLAHDCLIGLERVFQVVPYSKEDKVTSASHMVRGPTTRWWVSASSRMTIQGILKVWENFKAVFLDKYFLESLRAQKEFEFKQLHQGAMSIAQYTKNLKIWMLTQIRPCMRMMRDGRYISLCLVCKVKLRLVLQNIDLIHMSNYWEMLCRGE